MNITLKTLREQAGFTRKEVAKKLNMSLRAISHYECGTRHISIEQVLALAELYSVSDREVIMAQLNSVSQTD